MRKNKKLSDMPIEVRVEKAMQQAVAKAIAENKRLGSPLAIWQDEKVVHVPPEELEVRETKRNYKTVKKNK